MVTGRPTQYAVESPNAVQPAALLTLTVSAGWWGVPTRLLRLRVSGTSRPQTKPRVQEARARPRLRGTAAKFLTAGWDFVGETANGTEDLWWILEGKDYPRLSWELGKETKSNRYPENLIRTVRGLEEEP
jgi:hypothetical protein